MELDLTNVLSKEEQEKINNLDLDALDTVTSKEEEFVQNHKGRFTSSTAFRLMGFEEKPEVFPDGAMSYVIDKVLESETSNVPKEIYKEAMQHGNDTEKEAAEEFMKATGLVVYNYGEDQEFIPKGQYEGCSPDGLIGEDGGLETKCPDSKTHYERLESLTAENFKKKLNNYYWQIQDNMRITGRKYWYFVDYDPRFNNENKRLLIIKIERNEEDILKLNRRTFTAVQEFKKRVQQLRS